MSLLNFFQRQADNPTPPGGVEVESGVSLDFVFKGDTCSDIASLLSSHENEWVLTDCH